jgi:hypothetical protein
MNALAATPHPTRAARGHPSPARGEGTGEAFKDSDETKFAIRTVRDGSGDNLDKLRLAAIAGWEVVS